MVAKIVFRATPSLLALLAIVTPASLVQAAPSSNGLIEGSEMTRDEFRGRALAQLCVIALNATAYYAVEGEFPKDYLELRASPAWNIDLKNIFTGEKLRDVYFEPASGDFTTEPELGFIENFPYPSPQIPMPQDPAPTGPGQEPGAPGGDQDTTASGRPQGFSQLTLIPPAVAIPRVDPDAVKGFSAGEVFYYTSGNLLQLVLFAPDGSYVEWVDEVPRPSFVEALKLKREGTAFPQDLYALQVLYYTQQLLPQYCNLVRFMASGESVPPAVLDRKGAGERLQMASEIGATVLNFMTKQPASSDVSPVPGSFLELPGTEPIPLYLTLASGQVARITDIQVQGYEAPKPKAGAGEKYQAPVPQKQGRGKARPGGGRKVR